MSTETMTDRELLELGAKAAGYQIEDREGGALATVRDDRWWPWNPLTDDGDALRLAVKMGMMVDADHQQFTEVHSSTLPATVVEFAEGDRHAATRRAIVRAAAELAKNARG